MCGQGNFHDFRPEFFKLFDSGLHGRAHFRIQSADHVFLGQAEFQPLDAAIERGGVIRHGLRDAGGIARVLAADDAQHDGGVAHVLGKASRFDRARRRKRPGRSGRRGRRWV